ncbi:ABC transporter ATPase [Flavobacteriaceae bacterium S356]|uniref:ABC transporter ATPase n=1 Tax=Asprobacillus argus TaxID=3076534 RepID=A0ABU3LH56_9FLAO|nr:ABC transporter ATPase [Flavobacteriaceae bacterium S356]
MFVEFTLLPETARLWVYPSSRKFYADETPEIEEKIKKFLGTWKEESPSFKASYQIQYNRFIILAADDMEAKMTTQDIDTSVQFILQLQEEHNVILLDKMNVCFKQGEYVQYKELKDFKKLLKNKALTGKSIVFDNLVQTKEEYEHYWEAPIEESWYNRFL